MIADSNISRVAWDGLSRASRRLGARIVVAFLIGCAPAAAQSFDVVVDFGLPGGKEPHGGVVEGWDGCLYGTTVAGGAGHGTLYRLCSGVSTTIFVFDGANTGRYPQGALTVGSEGQLYGTTRYGGASNAGTIFKFDPASENLTTLHVFNVANGSESTAELTEGSDGRLYGVTSMGGSAGKGTVFAIQKSGTGFTLLKSFTGTNGRGPAGKLVEASDGFLYGTTAMGGVKDVGTIFRMSSAGTLTTLFSFEGGIGGANPYGGLVQGTNGYLYGLTGGGGSNSQGTAYRMDVGGSSITVLRSFAGTDGSFPYAELIQGTDGLFYGTTMFGGSGYGVIFKMTATGAVTVIRALTQVDGARPDGALLQATNGRIYGTTPTNGPSGAAGTVFEVTPAGAFTRLHAFSGAPSTPHAPLLARADGSLYGVSAAGGAMAAGTIFKFVPGVSFDVVYGFSSANGAGAYDGLVVGADGSMYGTAPNGGAGNVGTIFKLSPAGVFTLLASAATTNSNGFYPYGSVVQAGDGAFYGVMAAGGAGGAGTIYKMSATGAVTLAHAFAKNTHGSSPRGRLTAGSDGLLYGTASSGGSSFMGTLFAYDTVAKKFTLLHTFSGTNGANPFGGLTEGSDGRLYGTTLAGGAHGYGTVFAFDRSNGQLTTLHSFKLTDGANPYSTLVEAGDGRLYGTASYGGARNLGTVFSIGKSGGYTLLHSFNGANGSAPRAGLTQGADSYLYGTTPTGGSTNSGVIFRITTGGGGGDNPPAAPSSLSATAASATRVNLAWTANSTDELEFEIERCQGSACSDFSQIGTAPAGTPAFADTTTAAGTTYRYRVLAANAAGKSAYSNTASVTTPSSGPVVTVTSPNTAVKWAVGSTQRIKWTHNRGKGSTVRIQVSRDGGASWTDIVSSVANSGATTGYYDWGVTAPATSQARIRVAFTDDAAADASNVNFIIGAPFVKVTSPNLSSTVLTSGTNASIKWTSNLGTFEKVKIELSLNGGTTYPIVMIASTPSDGAQSIAIQSAWISATAKVRITWLKNANVADESDQAFVVK